MCGPFSQDCPKNTRSRCLKNFKTCSIFFRHKITNLCFGNSLHVAGEIINLHFVFTLLFLKLLLDTLEVVDLLSSSATVSACFLRRPAAVASCWRVDSSRSRRSFWNSASRFLFISIWAAVAPPASSSLSLISSSSLERSALCFSTLARAARSASISSSSSSMRAYSGK